MSTTIDSTGPTTATPHLTGGVGSSRDDDAGPVGSGPRVDGPERGDVLESVAVPGRPDVDDPERGDVPGWVLVTLMTAGLVVALWAIAGPALTAVFTQAIARVTGFGG